jgi:malate dehydrogenase
MDNTNNITVTITGAAGQIGYSLAPMIASGKIFGDKHVTLNLLDIPMCEEALKGVVMEIEDCCFSNFKLGYVGTNAREAFKDCDVIVFLGGFPRKQGMERKELISKNVSIYKEQGLILNEVGKETCKCIVVANPANTNCMMLAHYASKLPKKNFSCLTRLDQNRAVAHIANKLNKANEDVKNVIIWGNHSSTQYPDVTFGHAERQKIKELMKDSIEYLEGEFIEKIRKRGADIIAARKMSSSMSAAKAVVDHIRDWYNGTKDGEFVSMGVISDGTKYNIDEGLCYSFPCRTKNFDYEIVEVELDSFSKDKLEATKKELLEEKEDAYST